MAQVKSFRIHPEYGISDKDVRDFLTKCEEDGIIRVTTAFIPGSTNKDKIVDPRLTVIVTKLDDHVELIETVEERNR